MILNENELRERIESPMNLLNRLKNAVNPHKPQLIPSLPPSSDEIIKDLNNKITNGSIKSKALALMSESMDELKKRLPEVQKPEKLAAIAADMGKIVNNVETKNGNGERTAGQIIIYAPQIVLEETFNVIELID